jgi:hypothetical protein
VTIRYPGSIEPTFYDRLQPRERGFTYVDAVRHALEGSFELEWERLRRVGGPCQAPRGIHALALGLGTMTLREITHTLVSRHFAVFLRSEYSEAVRELVDLGGFARMSRKGIKENDHLHSSTYASGNFSANGPARASLGRRKALSRPADTASKRGVLDLEAP